jgi:LysR family nod box-dependent transcriptional activator
MGRFNLNSYFALDAILSAPTLTEAARSVHLSQPAMSLALKKLRDIFGDELVRYEHGRAVLTPLAQQLAPQVREILRLSRAVLEQSRSFDPKTASRTFKVAMPKFVAHFIMPKLVAQLALEAPGIMIDEINLPLCVLGNAQADVFVIPEWLASTEEPSFPLFYEDVGCACHIDRAGERFREDEYLALNHVAMGQTEEELFWPPDDIARTLLSQRAVTARANSIEVLQQLIIEADLVATLSMRLAQNLAISPLVAVRGAPPQFMEVKIVTQPALGRSQEPANMWLVQQIRSAARKIGGRPV